MFISQEYMNEFDVDNLLEINEDNDQYRSYSSTTSDIDDESFEEKSLSCSDDYSYDADSFFKSDETNDVELKEPQQSFLPHHGAIDYIDVRPHGNLNQYLNNAPSIPDGIDQRTNHVNIDLSDDYIKKVYEANKFDKPVAKNKKNS